MLLLYFSNGQRPGAVTGFTLAEFKRAQQDESDSPGTVVLKVKDHKGKKPARVVASGSNLANLYVWVDHLRPHYITKSSCQSSCQLVFPSQTGNKLVHFSRSLTKLAKRFGLTIPTPTLVRKSIVTQSLKFSDSDRTSLAQAMSHTPSTAHQYYTTHQPSTTKRGYEVIGEMMEKPLSSSFKKRTCFTVHQTEIIKKYFSKEIEKQIMPTSTDLEKFLELHHENFLGRNCRDIYSKIRNIIGRK